MVKDAKGYLTKESISMYLTIKQESDYTYRDMVMVLREQRYGNIPYNFMVFMGRMLEITTVRLTGIELTSQSREYALETTNLEGLIKIPMKDVQPTRVSVHYKYPERQEEAVYYTDEILENLNKRDIEEFLSQYLKVSVELLVQKDEYWKTHDLHMGWINITLKLAIYWRAKYNLNSDTYRFARKNQFNDYYKEYTTLHKLPYNQELVNEVNDVYSAGYKRSMGG